MGFDDDEKLYPPLQDKVSFPEDFPEPCNCLKCTCLGKSLCMPFEEHCMLHILQM